MLGVCFPPASKPVPTKSGFKKKMATTMREEGYEGQGSEIVAQAPRQPNRTLQQVLSDPNAPLLLPPRPPPRAEEGEGERQPSPSVCSVFVMYASFVPSMDPSGGQYHSLIQRDEPLPKTYGALEEGRGLHASSRQQAEEGEDDTGDMGSRRINCRFRTPYFLLCGRRTSHPIPTSLPTSSLLPFHFPFAVFLSSTYAI